MGTNTQTEYSITSFSDKSVSNLSSELDQQSENRLEFACLYVLLGLTLLFPFFFAGVHATTYLVVINGIFALTVALLVFRAKSFQKVFNQNARLTRIWTGALISTALYTALQPLLISAQETHPIVFWPRTAQWLAALDTFGWFVFATSIFALTSLVVRVFSHATDKLLQALLWSGIFVSLTGVAHWFHDNGKLFWIFTPDWMAVTRRARWPFVNPDHYGHFLLLCFFPALAMFQDRLDALTAKLRRLAEREARWVSTAFIDKRCQQLLMRLLLPTIAVAVCALGIFASLSRAAWLGFIVGLFVMILMTFRRHHSQERTAALTSSRAHDRQRRSSLNVKAKLKKVLKSPKFRRSLPFIALGAVVLFLLNEQGSDLVANRIEYGLLHSKEDIRFQMYSDTFPMIADHLWFGVGPGSWINAYHKYMNPLLAGLNHGHLHSDPLQFLAEFGIIGVLPIACAVVILFASIVKRGLRSLDLSRRLKLSGITSALIAFSVAVSFDFSLRIPAILVEVMILLALLTYLIESKPEDLSDS